MTLYDEQIFSPELLESEDLKDLYNKIYDLDNAGILISVLVNEYLEKCDFLLDMPPDPSLIAESREFIRYLYNIATKSPGIDVELGYEAVNFNIHILLIGDNAKLTQSKNYIYQAQRKINQGAERIYLIADTKEKSDLARKVAVALQENDCVTGISSYRYRRKSNDKVKKGVCIAIHVASPDKSLEPQQTL